MKTNNTKKREINCLLELALIEQEIREELIAEGYSERTVNYIIETSIFCFEEDEIELTEEIIDEELYIL